MATDLMCFIVDNAGFQLKIRAEISKLCCSIVNHFLMTRLLKTSLYTNYILMFKYDYPRLEQSTINRVDVKAVQGNRGDVKIHK